MKNYNQDCAIVVTTISEPNKALKLIAQQCHKKNIAFYAIGDLKKSDKFSLKGCDFYSTEKQKKLPFSLAKTLPYNHYSRKNIGYLLAMQAGHKIIVETDDDNIPLDTFWHQREREIESRFIEHNGWVNVYRFFTQSFIWPRGYPLEAINNNQNFNSKTIKANYPIQQGMANDNPDVDAVYRLTLPLPIIFENNDDIGLSSNAWCPFNSQNTTWFKEAFPLMYLPSFCNFRATDIWRSFIAQRIAWACDWNIAFYQATVYQERNEHNLLSDFEDEIPGYLNNAKICNTLQELDLLAGAQHMQENLLRCYKAMIKNKWIENEKELSLLDNWLEDIDKAVLDLWSAGV